MRSPSRGGLVSQTGGAGLFSHYGTVILNSSTVTLNNINSSSLNAVIGAGLYSYYGYLEVNNSTVASNTNTTTQTSALADGGGIGINNGSALIRGSTISGNVARRGGGVAGHTGYASIVIENSVIRDNRAQGTGQFSGGADRPACVGKAQVALYDLQTQQLLDVLSDASPLIIGERGDEMGIYPPNPPDSSARRAVQARLTCSQSIWMQPPGRG